MSEQYRFQDGKLIVSNASSMSGATKACIFLFCVLAAGAGGFGYAWKKYALPPDAKVISITDYENFQETERSLNKALEQNIKRRDYILDHDKLKVVFSEVFPHIRISDELLDTYIQSVSKWGAEYSIPPLLLLSIIWRESSFNAATHSSANARGPMQVIYKYHDEKLKRIGKKEMDLHEIDTGIRIGTEIMREYFDRFDQDIFRAMKAYVGGTHRTYAQDILTRYFRARIYVEQHFSKQ